LKRTIILLPLLLALTPVASAAEQAVKDDKAFTVYVGYRDGGSFSDTDSDQSIELKGSGALSLALDIGIDGSHAYQVFLSQQRTDLDFNDTPTAAGETISMDVTYLHVGGTYFWNGGRGRGPYAVGGLGATYYAPGSGYDSELRPSLNVGIGYEQPLGKKFSLRFEARGYATFVNSSGGFFCSGGCVVSVSADVVGQGEVMMGLSAHF
jgi:hypothetical protein